MICFTHYLHRQSIICAEYVESLKRKIHEITGIQPEHQVQYGEYIDTSGRVSEDVLLIPTTDLFVEISFYN